MSSNIKETIDNIILKHFGFHSRIDLLGFTSLLKELQTMDKDLELNEETIKEIFEILHPDENGLISSNEVENLVNTIIPIYAEKQENRGSIFYDKNEFRFTYTPIAMTNIRKSNKKEENKIASDIMNNLTLEKLSDLKFIYHSTDKNNRNFVDYLANDLKSQLSISETEIEIIFSALKDEETNQVTFEVLSELISKLEKDIFNCFNDEGREEEKVGRVSKDFPKEKVEILIDSNEENVEESSYYIDSPKKLIQKLKDEVLKVMMSKIGEANSLSIKLKSFALDNIMKDLKKFLEELEKRLFFLEENTDKFLKNYEMIASKEDLQLTKMKALESDIKKQFILNEKIEEENDQLYKELNEATDSLERFRLMCQTQHEEIFKLEDEKLVDKKQIEQIKALLHETQKKLEFSNENYEELKKMIQKNSLQSENQTVETNKTEDKAEKVEISIKESDLIIKEQEISHLKLESENLQLKIQEFQLNDEQNDKIILSLKSELRKLKEADISFINNRASLNNSTFLTKNNLKQQLKVNSDFPGIFNSRISIMKNRLSRLKPSYYGENKESILEIMEEVKEGEDGKEQMRNLGGRKKTFLGHSIEDIPENKKKIGEGKDNLQFSGSAIEYKYLFFDEASLFAKDFLGIREDAVIVNLLNENGEEKFDLECFTDYINRLFLLENKKKLAIFISNRNLYFLDPKRYKIIRKVPLPSIKQIVISEKSAILMGLKIKEEVDDLIESFRRADLILYMMQVFKKQGYPMFERVFEKEFFNIRVKGKTHDPKNEPKIMKKFNPEIQQAYKHAIKIGFLALFHSKFLMSAWEEYFFLLTNVGLITFEEEGEVKPRHFIPILGCLIDQNPINCDKSYCFKIYYVESQKEILLAAKSEAEKKDWIQVFSDIKKKDNLFDEKKL